MVAVHSYLLCTLTQVINNAGYRQQAHVTLTGIPAAAVDSTAKAQILTGAFPEVENSLEYPHNVRTLTFSCMCSRV